jgi:hypothetical protein
MAIFRLVSNDRDGTPHRPGWYVERCPSEGTKAEVVSPLFFNRWQAQAEVERLAAAEPDPHN